MISSERTAVILYRITDDAVRRLAIAVPVVDATMTP